MTTQNEQQFFYSYHWNENIFVQVFCHIVPSKTFSKHITHFLRQPSILAYPNTFINTDFGNFNPPPHPTL